MGIPSLPSSRPPRTLEESFSKKCRYGSERKCVFQDGRATNAAGSERHFFFYICCLQSFHELFCRPFLGGPAY